MGRFKRNKPCWCGSGVKFKFCHYLQPTTELDNPPSHSEAFDLAIRKAENDEKIRKMQQGLGRPIVSAKMDDHQFVAAGNTIYFSKRWRTFPDFLFDYIGHVFGHDWCKVEANRDEPDLHPMFVWFRRVIDLQNKRNLDAGKVYSTEMTGAVICYLGLAYNLYLLKHNAELQSLLIRRLKVPAQFQGAYYELIVANCLIRAGFELEIEDETNSDEKHCEFSARSLVTGEKYWIEAKIRGVEGVLGKTKADSAKGSDPTSQLTKHIKEALKKPAPDKRMIFADVNAPPEKENREPSWSPKAYDKLARREADVPDGDQAYVFVTNFPYHRALDDTLVGKAALAFGLGIDDFAKVGYVGLTASYRSKRKHRDAFNLMEAMKGYPTFPETLDGLPAGEDGLSQKSGRFFVGGEYFFEETEGNGTVGVLKSIIVHEDEGSATVVIATRSGRNVLAKTPITSTEIAAYKKYGKSYFGERESGGRANDEFELFEFFVENHINLPRNRLLHLIKDHPHFDQLAKLEHEDLVFAICENYVLSARQRSQR